jgi:predicted transcriptional regulator
MERILDKLEKVLLESLETKADFVDAAQLVYSLNLKNEMLATLAIDDISDLSSKGLIEVADGTNIKITALGRATLAREGCLDQESKIAILR